MFYQGSEIDFRNGHVAGWKIDSEITDTGETLARSAAGAGRCSLHALARQKAM